MREVHWTPWRAFLVSCRGTDATEHSTLLPSNAFGSWTWEARFQSCVQVAMVRFQCPIGVGRSRGRRRLSRSSQFGKYCALDGNTSCDRGAFQIQPRFLSKKPRPRWSWTAVRSSTAFGPHCAVAVFPNHISSFRHRTVGAHAPQRSSRHRECLRHATRQHCAPPLNQARRANARISSESERTLARASCLGKSWASSDDHPSFARKDHQASATVLTSQLGVNELLPPTCLDKGSTICAALSPQSPVSQTRVWAPWKNGMPSATTSTAIVNPSSRRRSRSWTRMLVDTLAPASRQARSAQHSRGSLVVPAPLMPCKRHGGGHESQLATPCRRRT